MLDKQTVKMLEIIARTCADGSYKIIEINDLIKGMSPRFKIDADIVSYILKFLTDNEMIDIKYKDENVYCIAILPKGRIYIESKNQKNSEITVNKRIAKIAVIGGFIAALIGSFVGVLLAHIIKMG